MVKISKTKHVTKHGQVKKNPTKHTIDIEPKWVNLLPYMLQSYDNLTTAEARQTYIDTMKQAGKVMDTVRQAQKKGKTVTFYPDGRVDVR